MKPDDGYKILNDIFNNDTAYDRGYIDGYDDGYEKGYEIARKKYDTDYEKNDIQRFRVSGHP